MADPIIIRRAIADDLEIVARLFDEYRQFYRQPADRGGCLEFLAERMARDESVILVAENAAGGMLGFTQLYESFCSVALGRRVVLYDLYVAKGSRRSGIAEQLMEAARAHAEARGAVRISLETANDNTIAQSLYEKLGYRRDQEFLSYHLELGDGSD